MAKYVIHDDLGIDEHDFLVQIGSRRVRDRRWLWLRKKDAPVMFDAYRKIHFVITGKKQVDA